jgi:uncharacterized caspase-like protein
MVPWARNIVAALMATLCLSGGYARAENRVALVLGNSSYRSVPPLQTPATDAKAFADLLTAAHFQVTLGADVAQADMRRAIRDFSAAVAAKGPDTVALVFYSGYGIQVDGENFLIPIDARIERESDVAVEALRLADLVNAIGATASRTRIVIVDAAHGNPFTQFSRTSGRGMAMIDAPTGTIVAYSAAPGTEGANRPFTATLINASKIPGQSINEVLGLVRIAMFEAGNGNQLSWETSKLTTAFSLFPGSAPTAAPDPRIKPAEFWRQEILSRSQVDALRLVLSQDETLGYEEFLRVYTQSSYAPQLRSLLDRRREMVDWQAASKANSVASYEAFVARYPKSDLVPTARRLWDRARATVPPASAPPAAVPASPTLAAAPAVAGPERASKTKQAASRREKEDVKPRTKKQTEAKPRKERYVSEPPPAQFQNPPISMGFGLMGFGRMRFR